MNFGLGIDTIRDTSKSIKEKRNSTLSSLDDALASASTFDFFRMLGQSVFVVLPALVSLLGLCSVICRCGCGSMCMALIFIYLSFFYYLFAAVFMLPSAF